MEDELCGLSGIGFYIVVVVGLIVFDCQVIVVDGNVECVMVWIYDYYMFLFVVKFVLIDFVDVLILVECPGDYV